MGLSSKIFNIDTTIINGEPKNRITVLGTEITRLHEEAVRVDKNEVSHIVRPRQVAIDVINRLPVRTRISLFVFPVFVSFGLFTLAGYFTGSLVSPPEEFAQQVTTGFHRGMMEIFINNLIVILLASVFGAALFPLAIILGQNGFMLGANLNPILREYGVSGLLIVAPHGILEIPALLLASAAGIRLYSYIYTRIATPSAEREFVGVYDGTLKCLDITNETRKHALYDYSILVVAAIILLFIAAIIETTITVELVQKFLIN